MAIPSDERIVIETPTRKRWRRLLLRINGPMAAGDVLSLLLIRPAELVKTMQRLQHAAQRRAPLGGASRRA
jgi:hypothetical protein